MILFTPYIIKDWCLGTQIYYIGTISIEIRTNPLKDSMVYVLLTKHRTNFYFILIKIPQNECQSETQYKKNLQYYNKRHCYKICVQFIINLIKSK